MKIRIRSRKRSFESRCKAASDIYKNRTWVQRSLRPQRALRTRPDHLYTVTHGNEILPSHKIAEGCMTAEGIFSLSLLSGSLWCRAGGLGVNNGTKISKKRNERFESLSSASFASVRSFGTDQDGCFWSIGRRTAFRTPLYRILPVNRYIISLEGRYFASRPANKALNSGYKEVVLVSSVSVEFKHWLLTQPGQTSSARLTHHHQLWNPSLFF